MGTQYKDLKYSVFSARLSDEVIEELKKRRNLKKSWNLLFKELLDDGKRSKN